MRTPPGASCTSNSTTRSEARRSTRTRPPASSRRKGASCTQPWDPITAGRENGALAANIHSIRDLTRSSSDHLSGQKVGAVQVLKDDPPVLQVDAGDGGI